MAVINPGVTSVGTTGTVSGITLTGGPITSRGTVTLGGTLDLSSPPAIGSTAANTGAFTTLSASSTVSGTGFSTYLASPPAIGGTTPAAGTFTTLTAQNETLKGTGNNIVLYSQAINGTNWATLGSATLTGNSTTAPDSTSTASTLTASGTQSAARKGLNSPYTATSGETYTASIYFKAGTASYGWISLTFVGTVFYAWFNLSAGTLGTANSGVTATITSVGNGWYRCSASGVSTNAFPYVDFGVSGADNTTTVTSGTTIYLWGAQLEIGSVLGAYIPTTSAVVYGTPTLSFSGVASIGLQSDGSLYETSAGTGNIRFYTNNIAQEQARVTHTANAVNYQTLTGSATSYAPVHSVAGSDANIALAFQSKGTGAIDLAAGSSGVNISNGGTVTAVTGTSAGAYTILPTITIAPPTTAGGTTATASASMQLLGSSTIAAAGSGYAIGDTITLSGGTFTTAAVITVATLSGSGVATFTITTAGGYTVLPSNPISTTSSGAGTGFQLTGSWGIRLVGLTVTSAGSGYVEQPAVTFTSAGGSGAAAYATVGSGTIFRSLGSTSSFYTPSGEVLRLTSTAATNTNYISITGDGSGNTPTISATNNLRFTSGGGATLIFSTNSGSQTQMQVTHTASAVNYVQVTGAATGSGPTISSQGSDASARLNFSSKGSSGGFDFLMNNTRQLFIGTNGSAVNYFLVGGTAAGVGPAVSVAGSDTDIQLSLVPKGLGIVLMNQQTPTAVTATGTLTIANLLTQIITSTSATAVSLTLPTGTLSDAGVSGGTSAVNTSFDWSIINTGSAVGDVTLVAGTGHTIVGSVTVTVGTSGRFRSRKTATNTFVTYRV